MKQRIVVSKDGKGDFKTVQEAIDAVPDNNGDAIEIFIKPGRYYEKIVVRESKTNITMIGEDRKNTLLEYDDYAKKHGEDGKPLTTYRTPSVTVEADDFKAKELTFLNSAGTGDIVGQAVAVLVLGDRCVFKNCTFLAYQDTFYTKGVNSRIYVKDCFIEGDIDFIFGSSTSVFETCIISSINEPAFVTAPSTPISRKYGYLFEKCRLVSALPPKTVYLGRPWHPGGDPDAIASVVFKYCDLGAHIKDEGWTEMNGFKAEEARMYEYQNSGPGAVKNDMRRQLSAEQASEYTPDKMLTGDDNWNFRAEF